MGSPTESLVLNNGENRFTFEADTTAVKSTDEAYTFIEDWHAASAASDYEQYFGAMPESGRWIGTDASENWDRAGIMAYGKKSFDAGRGWAFKTLERNVYQNAGGDVFWFDELLDTAMGVCRGSGVITQQGDSFQVEHYVFSVTVPNDDVPALLELKKEKDAAIISSYR